MESFKNNENTFFSKNNNSSQIISFIENPLGKSSLINTILGDDRLVTLKAGLTHSIQIPFSYMNKKFSLIDTAGIRKTRVNDHLEKQSVSKSMLAIRMSDVVILVLDHKKN